MLEFLEIAFCRAKGSGHAAVLKMQYDCSPHRYHHFDSISISGDRVFFIQRIMYFIQLSIRVSVTGKAFYGIMLLRSRLDTS